MPIFDFSCEVCGHEFEKLVMKSDAPAPNCSACDSDKVVKHISAPAFRLAGSGWYETDFKTGKKKNLAGGDAEKSTTAPTPAPEKAAASAASAKTD